MSPYLASLALALFAVGIALPWSVASVAAIVVSMLLAAVATFIHLAPTPERRLH